MYPSLCHETLISYWSSLQNLLCRTSAHIVFVWLILFSFFRQEKKLWYREVVTCLRSQKFLSGNALSYNSPLLGSGLFIFFPHHDLPYFRYCIGNGASCTTFHSHPQSQWTRRVWEKLLHHKNAGELQYC